MRKHNKPTSKYPVMQKANVLAMNVLIAEKRKLVVVAVAELYADSDL